MSDHTDSPPPNLQTLKQECHRLIEAVARRPGAMKLMIGVQRQLEMFADYKSDRKGQMQRRIRK